MPEDRHDTLHAEHPLIVFVPPASVLVLGAYLLADARTAVADATGWLTLFLGALWFVYRLVLALTSRLVLTRERLMARTGVLAESTVDFPLSAIESIEASRGPVGRLFGYGSVVVRGAGGTKTKAYLVGSPDQFRKDATEWVARHRSASPASSIDSVRADGQPGPEVARTPTPPIELRKSTTSFALAPRVSDEEWLDTSFFENEHAIGRLRFPIVNNGRYESRHAIYDASGTTVGYLSHGRQSLGYTFECVFAGDCFWVAHQGFGETMSGGGSHVSVVEQAGSFRFSNDVKFDTTKAFGFGSSWVRGIRAFKILDDGASLLYLTNDGVGLFDTRTRELVARVDWPQLAYQWSGFALSPKVKLLAMGCSVRGSEDPVDGHDRYTNSVRLYNLKTGALQAEHVLEGNQRTSWLVDFSDDGRHIQLTSDSTTLAFELSAAAS